MEFQDFFAACGGLASLRAAAAFSRTGFIDLSSFIGFLPFTAIFATTGRTTPHHRIQNPFYQALKNRQADVKKPGHPLRCPALFLPLCCTA
jgi:hypothetical protein